MIFKTLPAFVVWWKQRLQAVTDSANKADPNDKND